MLIAITDYIPPPFTVEQAVFGPEATLVGLGGEDEHTFDPDVLAQADALLVWHAHIGPTTAARLTRCRVVVRFGVGYDNIDIAALAARNIPFCNTPDYGTEEVADTAAGLLLSHLRRLPEYDHACRRYAQGWQEHVLTPLTRARHATVGVVGVGRIGTALINRLKPFGYRLLGYDPYLPSGHEKAVGYERVDSLDALLAQCDAVSLHCPLTPETAGMVDDAFLATLKPGAVLVNTARGGLCAGFGPLHTALRDGRLAAAGLDVLPEEPPGDHPLIRAWRDRAPWLAGRLTITPHTAYYSEQAWAEMRAKAAETALMALTQGRLRNLVPPEHP